LTQRPFFVCVPPEYHTAILFWLDDQYAIAEASHPLALILHSQQIMVHVLADMFEGIFLFTTYYVSTQH
jgi:hypothetical protein